MKNEEFDKLLKRQMQEDKHIPDKINQLFSDFEMEVKMKENKSNNIFMKFNNYVRTVSVAASIIVTMFLGGSVYAHINGKETIISPLLRNMGINSRYEQNATQFSQEVTKKDVTIKMLDGALDDTTFIVGYEINIENNNPDNWIEIDGEYKINNLNVKPINSSIDKLSDTSYVYYQVFDVKEIKIDNNVKFNAKINQIKEYMESETIDSVEAVYGNSHKDGWSLEEKISVKNLNESKVYEFANNNYEIIKGVKVSVSEFMIGSYTNILKIKTDKTNYKGNSFEKYYKIKDEQNKEIAMFAEENKEYDSLVYTDRLPLNGVNKNSKITVEVFVKTIDGNGLKKVAIIPVDLSSATEKVENKVILKQYKKNNYSFKYNENWNLIEQVDTTRVGPNSIYLGALELEISSTTNSEAASSIYVKTIDSNTTMDEYIKQVKKENTNSPSEYYKEKSSSEVNFKNQKGYQITAITTDGETNYIKQDMFTIVNGKVYRITFFGSEIEYNNLKSDIEAFVNNFEI